MKTFYGNWNKETLDDSVILNDIKLMSDGKLTLNIEKVREDNLFEKLYKEKKQLQPVQREQRERNGGGGGGKHRHQKPFNKNKNRRRRD
jgi:hypothetical protein